MSVINLSVQLLFIHYRRNTQCKFVLSKIKMKMYNLAAVFLLLLDMVKSQVCSEKIIAVRAFLNDTTLIPYINITMQKNLTAHEVCIDYIASEGCKSPSTFNAAPLCENYLPKTPDSGYLVLRKRVDGRPRVEIYLGCPYSMSIESIGLDNETHTVKCNITLPGIASNSIGTETRIRNDTFYQMPNVTLEDVRGGFKVTWNASIIPEEYLPNVTFYIDVFHGTVLEKQFNVSADMEDYSFKIDDNSTVNLEFFFMDFYGRRSQYDTQHFNITKQSKGPPLESKLPLRIIYITAIIVIIVLIGFIFYGWRRQRARDDSGHNSANDWVCRSELFNPIYFLQHMPGQHHWRFIRPSELVLIRKLGEGNFGEVSLNVWRCNESGGIKVAVKTLKHSFESSIEYINEIKIFKKVGSHQNIVQMLGYNIEEQPWFIVMEYIDLGDLAEYLRKLRHEFEESRKHLRMSDYEDNYILPDEVESYPLKKESLNNVLSTKDLESFGRQIALGMEHLELCNVIHRDLAARNILLTRDKIIKITDFGLSRDGNYGNCKRKDALPIRWMAPETYIDSNIWVSKSDVWSFGVVLWEIGTLGGLPYEGLNLCQMVAFLKSQKRLEQPETIKDSLYALMMRCWEYDYQLRPTFKEIVQEFESIRSYFELSSLRPDYILPSYIHISE